MKQHFFIWCIVFATILPRLSAQNRFEVGVGVSQVSLEKSSDRFLGNIGNANWRTAMSAGMLYTIPCRNWRFGTGLSLSIKGEKGYLEKRNSRPFYVVDIKYLELPVRVSRVIRSKYLVTVGMHGGYAIQSQIKGYVVGDPVRKEHRPYRTVDLGLQAGVGYQFCQRFTVGLAYGFSLLDIGIEQRYNRLLNLHLNYALFLK